MRRMVRHHHRGAVEWLIQFRFQPGRLTLVDRQPVDTMQPTIGAPDRHQNLSEVICNPGDDIGRRD